jgi:hypothetical protein
LQVRKEIVISCERSIQRKRFPDKQITIKKETETGKPYRSQTIKPMTMATTSKAPRTYLLDDNQDSDGAAELKNKVELSEPETFSGTF